MSPQVNNLVEKIEDLRNRIDHLRREIWARDRANLRDQQMESDLEKLLIEYLSFISAHEDIAC
ncbi:MAG: hypothetical protein P4N59_33650 [Negativicutes bacterium]|nr:hypothetical protein [Negativicutes bacterium]